ncbi:hypothetical protein GGTG_04421 [Gaeumannomyces tritici R3-111a-1]|uniref:Uncharacterized protein n=1 Tax=Gaeumannomyces tritici (strain R3-111a-1) TaxID=644352 RepID=J3NT23_GAET3|nr:hypothetical protein GGTG_04421 [Gaeumannomyces tritici R3-111a-1]EJT79336.1 hypothetical protein GGTG_04421 [Gaeumannomyces tritici R3-111a-1]
MFLPITFCLFGVGAISYVLFGFISRGSDQDGHYDHSNKTTDPRVVRRQPRWTAYVELEEVKGWLWEKAFPLTRPTQHRLQQRPLPGLVVLRFVVEMMEISDTVTGCFHGACFVLSHIIYLHLRPGAGSQAQGFPP